MRRNKNSVPLSTKGKLEVVGYDFENTIEIINSLQPKAIIMNSNLGPIDEMLLHALNILKNNKEEL